MTRESLEELRERLLRQHNVQRMIQIRAYEIYQMRGGHPGGEAQDWFQAEGEVLAFLLADESAREDDVAKAVSANAEQAPVAPATTATKKPRSRAGAKPKNPKAAPKKATAKRATTRTSAESKSKSTRISGKSKTEKSDQ